MTTTATTNRKATRSRVSTEQEYLKWVLRVHDRKDLLAAIGEFAIYETSNLDKRGPRATGIVDEYADNEKLGLLLCRALANDTQ